MINLAVTIRARPETREEVSKILQGFVRQAKSEPGCLHYELFVSRDDGNLFYFFEKWADEPTYATHRRMPYLQAFRERATELLAAPNQVLFLTPLA